MYSTYDANSAKAEEGRKALAALREETHFVKKIWPDFCYMNGVGETVSRYMTGSSVSSLSVKA